MNRSATMKARSTSSRLSPRTLKSFSRLSMAPGVWLPHFVCFLVAGTTHDTSAQAPGDFGTHFTRGTHRTARMEIADFPLTATSASGAARNWMFSTAEPLPEPVNLPGTASLSPWLSADGLTLYFASDRPGGLGGLDIWRTERGSIEENWKTPVNLGAPVNSSGSDSMPFLTNDGLNLYFSDANALGVPARPRGPGNYQIWIATRATQGSPWQTPVDLKAPIGSSDSEQYPHLSGDGLSLYFTSRRPEIFGLAVSRRTSVGQPWLAPTKLPSTVTGGAYSGFPYLSSSELHLLFYTDRGGGQGSFDLWMTTRSSPSAEWMPSINLGAQVNGPNIEMSPCISADFPAPGSYLLFARNDTPAWNLRFKLYKATVIPSMTLLRASSLHGPWMPATASFTPASKNLFLTEVSVGTNVPALFFQLQSNGNPATVRFISFEKVGTRLKMQFELINP